MIEWILSSCVLILVVIAIRTFAKGKVSLRLQYAMWALVLARLLIPVSFGSTQISVANFTSGGQSVITDTHEQQIPHIQQPQELPPVTPGQTVPQQSPQITLTPSVQPAEIPVLPVIWVAGGAAVAALFLATNLRFRSRVRRSRSKLDAQKNGRTVYVTGAIDTPCLFGIVRPEIYVTPAVAEDATLLRHTLEHEATHCSHGDHIWSILRCICLVVHWYNPLVWWAAFLSQRDGELACDEATIQRLGEEERAEYGRTLIGMTCKKRANVLMTATTMTTGSSGLKERILLIARKPKMAVYTLVLVLLIAVAAVGCTFTGPGEEGDLTIDPPATTEPMQTEPQGTELQETEPQGTEPREQEYPEPGKLYDTPFKDKICVAVQPTGVCTSGDVFKYLVPRQQDALMQYYNDAILTARAYMPQDGNYSSGGWSVVYQGRWWRAAEDGALYGTEQGGGSAVCIKPEDARLVVALCQAAMESAGLGAPVRPQEIVGIKNAVLHWNGMHTVTDAGILDKIETMLHSSREIHSAGCWFTAALVLELENGETKTVTMATDNCATWMSEGVVYDYGQPDSNGNAEFYAIFSPMVIRQKAADSMDEAARFMDYMNWSEYARQFGKEEAFALIDKIGNWALDKKGDWSRYTSVLYWMNGLEGACADHYGKMLVRLYETKRNALAFACLSNAGEAERQQCISLLAKAMNKSVAAVTEELQEARLSA